MILIGKTANCLLGAYVMAHSAVLKAVDEFVRIRAFQFAIRTMSLPVPPCGNNDCMSSSSDSFKVK